MAANTSEQVNNKYKGLSKRGQTNNPGGRPKQSDEYKALVKANTVEAIKTVINIMQTSNKEELRLKAAQELIDRAYGKAAQPIVGDNEHDPVNINLFDQEQRRNILEKYTSLCGQNKD